MLSGPQGLRAIKGFHDEFFATPLIVTPDEQHSRAEPRFRALGQTLMGRRMTIIFTVRGEGTLLRVISARDMHRKERTLYEQQT